MADRPAAQKDEEYQPLWDTNQSVPEYMKLLMDQQPSTAEDATLYQESGSEDENLEHPDPDYEYVYPGAPKRYDSAREDSDGAELDSDELSADEPEETSKEAHESRKDDKANHPVALASTEPAPSPGAQTEVIGAAHAYGEYVRLESLGLSPGATLPVIPDPLFGTPDSKLIEMRLLDRSQDESAPMQACAAHLNPVKDEGNPVSRAAMIQPVGYVPVNRPPTRYSVKDLKNELIFTNIGLGLLLILNPFVLAPLASIVDPEYGFIIAFIFVVIGVGSLFVVPVLWIMGIVRLFKRRNQINDLIEEGQTPPTEFWYYLVYNRLPEGYTGVDGITKEEEDSFTVYEFLKKQERAKLREAAALQKSAAHPALADEEKQG
ncbi:MAG: pyruvate ferredoxin oxidoreductase [Rothia sp.]|uniref:pyruvate ferredoxin oxidoreductase n=1 Tax=Rothia sp. (in: high G+C Gram-positive bacteria) TaxID=1885016 RepID=UPI001CB557B0|nr:pyruvate ferredoxin oxidoreductase [Rothia sp. (in: high G+C Gram-positive bacteria)]MBF1680004.1 pyruvate ferredoxin oxidoreductase [Rothia sp. (in: high G+C Gram-positive bacteria)]